LHSEARRKARTRKPELLQRDRIGVRVMCGRGFANRRPSFIVATRRAARAPYFHGGTGYMAWIRAVAAAEIKDRGVMGVEVAGEEIALYWVDDAVYATHDVCTHAFARLSEGFLEGECIECPIHQALFNVKTGEVMAPPAYTPIKTYPCRIEGDDVLVEIGG
jgi:nitrite reductase/ring-hydroxylating ferredoxin subunit